MHAFRVCGFRFQAISSPEDLALSYIIPTYFTRERTAQVDWELCHGLHNELEIK